MKLDNSRPQPRRGDAPPLPWSVHVAAAEVPEAGLQMALSADPAVRNALAGLAAVDAVLRLDATFDIARHGRGGLRVTGSIDALVRQACVVTLEPVENAVHESVDLVFVAEAEPDAPSAEIAPETGDWTGDRGHEQPEPLDRGAVDLGALACEFLILGIDPYPRKAGVEFRDASPKPDASERPFAALQALKKGPNGSDR